MKRGRLKTMIFAALVAGAVLFYGHHVQRILMYQEGVGFWDFVQMFFLYLPKKSSIYDCLLFGTIFMLALFSFLPNAFASLRSYRSMLMHRYGRKTQFISHILRRSVMGTGAVSVWLALCIAAVLCMQEFPYQPSSEVWTLLLLMGNIFLYFNLCVLCKVFLCLCYNDVYADMLTAFVTVLLVYVDSKLPLVGILTWGSTGAVGRGMLLQVVLYGVVWNRLIHFMQEKDVL